MKPATRKRVVIGVAVASGALALGLLVPQGEQASAPASARDDAPRSAQQAASSSGGLTVPDRTGLNRSRGELFGTPPAPPPPRNVTIAPEAPVAPPMPYRFAGKVRLGDEEQVLVSKGDLVFPVKVGETIDGAYKVVSIGADRLDLVYLPLNIKDSVAINSALDVDPPTQVAAAPASAAIVAPVGGAAPKALPLAASPDGADKSRAQLRWEGPDKVRAGADFNVALRVSYDQPLRAAPMQLRFEPDVLEPVNVRPGKFFGTGNFSYRVNPDGSIFVGATSPGNAPGRDAELVIVTFRPLKAGGTAELNMAALSLHGMAGRVVAHDQFAAFRAPIAP
jgi:hypothetical protein